MLLNRFRARLVTGDGFTLVEILIVILIIGTLSAIAIPAFLNQQEKGHDVEAKGTAATGVRAMEACSTEHDGSYAQCDKSAIEGIEPTLVDADARLTLDLHPDSYSLSVESKRSPSVHFTISRDSDSTTARTCTVVGAVGRGGCPVNGNW